MQIIEKYLLNSHHMTEEELVQTLQELAEFSAKHHIEPLLRDRINLQLDTDNANADLFYSIDTAQDIHYLVKIIRKNLANQN